MRRSKVVLLSVALFVGIFPFVASAQAENIQGESAPQQNKPQSYEVRDFFSDSQHFAIGDVVPEKYRTKKYEITEWQKRHLPAPDEGSHWTYMGGNYVLISNDEGKILKAVSGDIFFQ